MLSLLKTKNIIMRPKTKKHSRKIKFSDINPRELWTKLGLIQSNENQSNLYELGDDVMQSAQIIDEESRRAYEAFMEDFSEVSSEISSEMSSEMSSLTETFIPEDKGSLFIWALLFEFGKLRKMTSLHPIFKDDMAGTILQKGQELGIVFEAQDFDDISSFLQNKGLIQPSKESIEIAQKFHQLFHKKIGWLVW